MADNFQASTNSHEAEITLSSQDIAEQLVDHNINQKAALSKLHVNKQKLISLQEELDQPSYLFSLSESIEHWSSHDDIESFTNSINQLIYQWLNAFDQGAQTDDILDILKCFKLDGLFGLSNDQSFHLFIHHLFIETLSRYHQITLDYVINFDESIKLPNTKPLVSDLEATLNQAKGNEITALFSLHFQTENNTLLLPKSAAQQLNNQLAEILTKNSNENSQLYFNGDYQFELLIAQVENKIQLDLLVAKIFRAFEEIVFMNRQSILVKPYIGCSFSKPNKLEANQMYRNAKKALEYGISKQEYYVVYSDELEQTINDQLFLESKVIEAFDSNNLILNFQPIVDLKTNHCVGAELLLRWSDEFGHKIPPNIAVEVLNSMGKGKLFTRWLINSACRYVHEITTEKGLNLYLTLNLRPEDLYDIELPSLFENALSLWKLDPQNIVLEITENGIFEQNEQTQSTINALSALGFKFALDDFGTGFSSLTRLQTLPIDIIKIDQTFVRNINNSNEDYEIVQSIAMLAKSLGKEVLSEGVENAECLDLIKKLNVDKCQGYYFSKPLRYDDFIKWVQAN